MKQILNLSRQSDVDGADGASVVDPSLCLGSSVKKTAASLIAWRRPRSHVAEQGASKLCFVIWLLFSIHWTQGCQAEASSGSF